MYPELLIFDLDGTLVDTIADLGYACNHALNQLQLPTHSISEYKHFVGNGIMRLLRLSLPQDRRDDLSLITLLKAHFMDYSETHLYDYSGPYKGIVELLSSLKGKYRLAVASNKYQRASETIVAHFFPGCFEMIHGEREGIPRKPDKVIIENIMGGVGIKDKGKVMMIGDSVIDVQTAKNAGIVSIACTWGFTAKESIAVEKPDHIVDSPNQILTFVGV